MRGWFNQGKCEPAIPLVQLWNLRGNEQRIKLVAYPRNQTQLIGPRTMSAGPFFFNESEQAVEIASQFRLEIVTCSPDPRS